MLQLADDFVIKEIKFDRMYSSNICDYVGLLNIIVHMFPLLKQVDHSTFQTTILYSLGSYESMKQYIFSNLGQINKLTDDFFCLKLSEGKVSFLK